MQPMLVLDNAEAVAEIMQLKTMPIAGRAMPHSQSGALLLPYAFVPLQTSPAVVCFVLHLPGLVSKKLIQDGSLTYLLVKSVAGVCCSQA